MSFQMSCTFVFTNVLKFSFVFQDHPPDRFTHPLYHDHKIIPAFIHILDVFPAKISLVMKYFEINYEKFIQTCDFTHLLDDYHRILANLNQPVRVIDGDRSFEGICRGIDEKGELLVERQNKEVVKVSAGEVSVRGLYSYV